jgi:putative aldouronate transport system permease protein
VTQVDKAAAKRSVATRLWRDRNLYLLLVPLFVYYLIFHYAPMYGITVAFQDYNMFKGMFGSEWIGLENFKRIFSTSDFFTVLRNTLMLSFLDLIVGFPAPIILALLLNEVRKIAFKRVVQTIAYLPHFLSWVIVASLVITLLSPSTGIVNHLIRAFGGEPIHFMGRKGWWITTYVASGIWKEAGWGTIIYLAALTAIDPNLYEAARIDGANRWKQTWRITIPAIAPTILVLLLLRLGNIMTVGFDKPFLLGNSAVIEVSDVISTYVYRIGLLSLDMSRSAAVGLFQSVINFMTLLFANWMTNRVTGEGIF